MKHIIANENDLLQSEVTETISPQQESSRGGTCSACFRSWSCTWIYSQIEIWSPRGTLLHSTSFPSRFFHVFSHSRLISFFSSHLVHVSSRLFVSAPERRPCHRVSVSMVTDLSNTLQGRKCFKRKRQWWEFVRRTSREVPAESSGREKDPKDRFCILTIHSVRLFDVINILLLLIHIFIGHQKSA